MSVDALDYYKYINHCTIKQDVKKPTHAVEKPGNALLDDAVDITVAQYDLDTKDFITAHMIKDYRRKQFTLALLPNVEVLLDTILEGSDYWGEKLQASGTYSG